jgi:hypothetical protein
MMGLEDIQAQWDNEAPEGAEGPETAESTDSPIIQIGSTTLSRLEPSSRPAPSTVCEGCPAAMWYARGKTVNCYCRIMHLISWTTGEPNPITLCDGPAIASQ